MPLTVEVAGKSDIGCVRANNEDNFGYDTRYGVFLVCDGMGGQAAGEVASKMAVDTVLNYFREGSKNGHFAQVGPKFEDHTPRANALASAIQLANSAVHEAGKSHAAHAGMGSTIVSVLVQGNMYSIAHVGDSRIYLARKENIQQLTNDHSLVMEQVRRGYLTMEQAEHSDMQNIILRALGSEETVQADVDDLVALPGDTLLLACDGLTKNVKDARMHEIITQAPTLDAAVDGLIQAAKDNGGDDNITVILIRFTEEPWYRRLFGGSAKWQNSI